MTYEEAIEIIKNNYPKTAKMVNGRYKGGFDDIESELGRALGMAIEALEKQLPKKPIFKIKEQYNEEYYLKKEYYICPNCGKTMVVQNHKEITKKEYDEIKRWLSGLQLKYCDECGQAIDWDE